MSNKIYVVFVSRKAVSSWDSRGGIRYIDSDPEKALAAARAEMEKKVFSLADRVDIMALKPGRTYAAQEITGDVGVPANAVFQAIIRSHAYDHRVLWQEEFIDNDFQKATNSKERIFPGEAFIRNQATH